MRLPQILIFRSVILLVGLLALSFFSTHAQTTYTLPEAAELNKLYTNTNGTSWKNKTGWPVQSTYAGTAPTASGIYFRIEGTTASRIANATSLSLSNNQLSGTISNFNLPKLAYLDLANNQLIGTIPNFDFPILRRIVLSNNQFTGTIPNFNLLNLTNLEISSNQLSGVIPNFNLPNLTWLLLDNNQLTGTIPNFNFPNLTWLKLSRNQLSGTIPSFHLPKLEHLTLDNNQLGGTIPNFNLPNLTALLLYHNQLSGTIPNFNLPKLSILVLSNNQLSGTIPNFNLPGLTILELSRNQLSGTIPNFNLPALTALSLDNNQLGGTIPNFNLPKLESLTLDRNHLNGTIPNFILPKLEYLNLSNNQLTGSNVDWNKMPNLRDLRLDNNKLIFRDLEPAARAMKEKTFSYSPQDSVTLLKNGDTLRMDVGGDSTSYLWYKNGQAVNGEIQPFYKTTDTALYSCVAKNSLLPQLTLYSRPVRGTVLTSVQAAAQPGSDKDGKHILSSLSFFPQPFEGQTTLTYHLTKRTVVSVTVYSMLGQKILSTLEGEQNAGTHSLILNMSGFGNGAYLVRVQAGEEVRTTFIQLIR